MSASEQALAALWATRVLAVSSGATAIVELIDEELASIKREVRGAAVEECCRTCRFFKERDGAGLCRAETPSMQGWPVVLMDDWCGDWEKR